MRANHINPFLAANLLGLLLLTGGCATPPGGSGGEYLGRVASGSSHVEPEVMEPEPKEITEPVISPTPPATLKTGEKVTVTAPYTLAEGRKAAFAVRPFNQGVRARSYMAHPVVACEPGKGVAEGWFTFQRPTTIDEIRILIIDSESAQTISETTIPAALTWE